MRFFRCSRACRCLPRCQAGCFGSGSFSTVMSVASIAVEDEDGAVFAGDLDRLAGFGALVEQVELLLRIVVWNPLADGLPGRLDGLEGLIHPPRQAGSPCGLRLRLRPKRLRSLGAFRCRRAGRVVAECRSCVDVAIAPPFGLPDGSRSSLHSGSQSLQAWKKRLTPPRDPSPRGGSR